MSSSLLSSCCAAQQSPAKWRLYTDVGILGTPRQVCLILCTRWFRFLFSLQDSNTDATGINFTYPKDCRGDIVVCLLKDVWPVQGISPFRIGEWRPESISFDTTQKLTFKDILIGLLKGSSLSAWICSLATLAIVRVTERDMTKSEQLYYCFCIRFNDCHIRSQKLGTPTSLVPFGRSIHIHERETLKPIPAAHTRYSVPIKIRGLLHGEHR